MLDISALDKIEAGTRLADLSKARMTGLQRSLSVCAYPLGVADGLFGPKTRNAYAECVADLGHGHPEIVGDETLDHLRDRTRKLAKILETPTATAQDTQDQIAEVFKFIGLGLKAQIAYGLATSQWETNHTFEPVREAYWLSEKWRRQNLRYYPYYGRGYVQLTWENNYRLYGSILDLDLLEDPDLAMRHDVALFTLAHGMKLGMFTGRRLEDFVSRGKTDFRGARKVINGTDKDAEIAELAEAHLDAL